MEPIPPPIPTKLEFLEYLKQKYDDILTIADLETSPYHLEWFERFKSRKRPTIIFEKYFNGDWRLGQEIHKVVLTKRLYQISPNSTQV